MKLTAMHQRYLLRYLLLCYVKNAIDLSSNKPVWPRGPFYP
jgi:hypothetical protein